MFLIAREGGREVLCSAQGKICVQLAQLSQARRHMIGKVVTGCVAILPYHTATQDRDLSVAISVSYRVSLQPYRTPKQPHSSTVKTTYNPTFLEAFSFNQIATPWQPLTKEMSLK